MTGALWHESVRGPMSQLSALVLYRTPQGWRYAIYSDGVMDGRLTGVKVDDGESAAQEALIRFIETGTGKTVHAAWTSTEPNWWTAEASLE